MALVWAIRGAGRGTGETHLAHELCAVLPRAVLARPGRSDDLAAFVAEHGADSEHIVVQSDDPARAGAGDITVFVEAATQQTGPRDQTDQLRCSEKIHKGPLQVF